MAAEVISSNDFVLGYATPAAETRARVRIWVTCLTKGSADSNAHSILPVSTELAGPGKEVGVNVQWPAVSCRSKLHPVGGFLQLGLQVFSLEMVKEK